MKILIIAELNEQQLASANARLVQAATEIGGSIELLLVGQGLKQAAEQAATLAGVERVLLVDGPEFAQPVAETLAQLTLQLAADYQAILANASTTGKNFLPRVAAKLDTDQVSEIIAVKAADTFIRPIYAGNVLAEVQVSGTVVATVRSSAFEAVGQQAAAAIVTINAEAPKVRSQLKSRTLSTSERPELTSASLVVSGGRGLGSGDNFALINALADHIGAAVGASRAAVDAGFVSNDHQVGQTGKIVAPDLYIAVGISGAIQHLAGMKASKVIVAINNDEDAPIFQVADYGLVADLFVAVPELTQKL